MTTDQESALMAAAQVGVKNALTKSLSPDDARYGAAVLTDKGNVYASGQYFSDTASLTLHAEQAAIAHAAAHGEYNITAIAIAWNDAGAGSPEESVYPCHMCKQLLWESCLRSGLEMELLIIDKEQIIERLKLTAIMSYTWPK